MLPSAVRNVLFPALVVTGLLLWAATREDLPETPPPQPPPEILAPEIPAVAAPSDTTVAEDAPPPVTRPASFDPATQAWLETPAGDVVIEQALLGRMPRADLRGATAAAREAGLRARPDKPWTFTHAAAVGWHLASADRDVLVRPSGVLRRSAVEAYDGEAARRALRHAVEQMSAELEAHPDPGLKRALLGFLGRLDMAPQNPDSTEVHPAYARLVATEAWLGIVAPSVDGETRRDLAARLTDALSPRATEAWTGPDTDAEFVLLSSAWGPVGAALWEGDHRTLVRPPPRPMDAGERHEALAACVVVLRESPRADSEQGAAAPDDLTHAALLHGTDELAAWSQADGFRCDDWKWRARFPQNKGRSVANGFPPHVAMADLRGALLGVAVPGGVLRPVRDDSPEEAARFLDDAARLLPDAAHLDLLQQYFMKYVYDSPDPSEPLVIGTREAHSDLHQTAEQTLATVAGGTCRGDCDDFAELASNVARRQGKLAHVLSVPAHLAATWAEPRNGGWTVYVLQTGPALQFSHEELPTALRKTYAHFDDTEPIDTDALSVALRFDGESIRERYRLSWRIYEDRAYADTLIGVQRDWHLRTLLQGIQKMQGLLEGGDTDPANYAELGALHAGTGQYAKAAEFQRVAFLHAPDEEQQLHRILDQFREFVAGRLKQKAVDLATEIRAERLPRVAPRWGLRALSIQSELASSVCAVGDPLLAAAWLVETASSPWANSEPSLLDLLAPDALEAAWGSRRQRRLLRRALRTHATACLTVLRKVDAKARAKDERIRQVDAHLAQWVRASALVELEYPDTCLDRWAFVGRWLETREEGDLLSRLEAVAYPQTAEGVDHAVLALKPDDPAALAWIKVSPYTYTRRLWDLATNLDERPDPARVKRLSAMLEESIEESRRLGFEILGTNLTVLSARLQAALILRDLDALGASFREVERLGSSRLASRAAVELGRGAAHLDLVSWKQAVACWIEEIGYKPDFLFVAWTAVKARAPANALHMADEAARRFPEDDAFRLEATFMRRLLDDEK